MRAPSPDLVRVLLVDDNQDDHRLLSDLLDAVTNRRFVLDWARDLETGRDRLNQGQVDVCLIDRQLPDGTGLDLLEGRSPSHRSVPMILMADHGNVDLDQQAMDLGAAGFLDKDRLYSAILERTIRYAISAKGAARQAKPSALLYDKDGLVAPALLKDRLAHALASAKRRQSLVALVLIELGAPRRQALAGDDEGGPDDDHYAARCARDLVQLLRATDTVARLDQQQFALIIEDLGHVDDAALVTEKALRQLEKTASSFGDSRAGSLSAGISLFPETGSDGDSMFRQAELALRRAKDDQARSYCFGQASCDEGARSGFLFSDDLRRALVEGNLTLRYRPSIHFRDGAISLSAEVYLNSPAPRRLRMEQFWPIAHDQDLIAAVTDWITGRAIQQLTSWQKQGLDGIELAIPFISKRRSDLPLLESALQRYLPPAGTDPAQLEIDLDQDLVTTDFGHDAPHLMALRATGVRLAIDEFVNCRASFESMASEVLNSLKLSSTVYSNLAVGGVNEKLLRALVGLGHDLDLRVVANGALDDRQFAFLRQAGVDAIKLGAPTSSLTPAMLASWLKKCRHTPMVRLTKTAAPSPILTDHHHHDRAPAANTGTTPPWPSPH